MSWCLGPTVLPTLVARLHQAWLPMLQLLPSVQHMQMAAPRATIGMNLAMGSGMCADDCTFMPHQIFYTRDAHHIPRLTFQLTMGWDTSCTTTLPVDTCQASYSS